MIDRCVESFKGQYDELIIIDDKDKSLAYKQNKGLRMATGTHLIVSNDDVVSNRGNLRDLCSNQVLSPRVNGGVFKTFHGHMFCLPRKIYAEVGGFDESYKGVYYIDSDLWYRLINAGYTPGICDLVDIDHKHPASTINTLDVKQKNVAEGREWFISKWGRTALTVVE